MSLPEVYFQVRDLVQKGVGTSELSNALSYDPGLTTRFLSIANSALFSPNTEISSISRAITLLGTQLVHDIVLATSVSDLFDGIPADLVDVASFWKQSVACGVLAKSVADHLNVLDSGHTFIQGLLADIGHVLMYQYETENMKKILGLANALGEQSYKIELRELGYDYCDIGGYLAEQWNLPAGIPETILHHQQPENAEEHEFEASIIHLARRLSEFRYAGNESPEFAASALSCLHLSTEDVLDIYAATSEKIDATLGSFGSARKAA